MTPAQLEQYLHQHIPLTRAMAITVAAIGEDAVIIAAPLAPNINPHHTVFGGSASAVAILAAWAALHVRMHQAGIAGSVVVRRNTMEYLQPITGDFVARAAIADPAAWEPFVRMLAQRGKARIQVDAQLECAGTVTGRLTGEFVALARE